MMFRNLLLTLFVLTASVPTHAQWQGGVGYAQFSFDNSSIDLGALVGTLGYQISAQSTFNHIFQFKAGLGITEDSIGAIDVEIDDFFQLAYRAEYDFTNELYAFVTPSVASLSVAPGGNDEDWELGVGVGAGMDIGDNMDVELSYESINDIEVLTIGARFSF